VDDKLKFLNCQWFVVWESDLLPTNTGQDIARILIVDPLFYRPDKIPEDMQYNLLHLSWKW